MKSCSNSFEHSRTINVHLPHIFALLQYKFLFPHPYIPLPLLYIPLPLPYVPFRTRFAGYLSADEWVFYVGHVLTFVKYTFHIYPRIDNTSDNGHSAEGWCVRDMREYPFWARCLGSFGTLRLPAPGKILRDSPAASGRAPKLVS